MATKFACHLTDIDNDCGYLCKVFQAGECPEPPLPERLYVQVELDGETLDPECLTFCVDRVNDSDLVYTREKP